MGSNIVVLGADNRPCNYTWQQVIDKLSGEILDCEILMQSEFCGLEEMDKRLERLRISIRLYLEIAEEQIGQTEVVFPLVKLEREFETRFSTWWQNFQAWFSVDRPLVVWP